MAIFVFFVCFSSLSEAQQIKILSWNVQLLPGILKPQLKKELRAEVIAQKLKQLNQYDVILLQEAFHQQAAYRIKEILKKDYPYQFGPTNSQGLPLKTNSGLLILSRWPAELLEEIEFTHSATVDDRFARKGSALIQVEINHQIIQIATTHLNADGPSWIHISQLENISDMLNKHLLTQVPQVLLGDFNYEPNSSNYRLGLKILSMQDGPLEGNKQFSVDYLENDYYRYFNKGTKRALIDFAFLRDDFFQLQKVKRSIVDMTSPGWNPDAKQLEQLSDHFPIEITLQF